MSRIGKKTIKLPPKVKVTVTGQHVLVEGPAGKLERDLLFSPSPDQEVLGEELIAIARAARTRR